MPQRSQTRVSELPRAMQETTTAQEREAYADHDAAEKHTCRCANRRGRRRVWRSSEANKPNHPMGWVLYRGLEHLDERLDGTVLGDDALVVVVADRALRQRAGRLQHRDTECSRNWRQPTTQAGSLLVLQTKSRCKEHLRLGERVVDLEQRHKVGNSASLSNTLPPPPTTIPHTTNPPPPQPQAACTSKRKFTQVEIPWTQTASTKHVRGSVNWQVCAVADSPFETRPRNVSYPPFVHTAAAQIKAAAVLLKAP
jgi:hypothetical protein